MSDALPLTEQPEVIRDAVRALGPAATLAEGIVQQAALAYARTLDATRAAQERGLDVDLARDARDHIEALNRLLAAYRVGSGRTPEKALDALDRTRDVPARLAAIIEEQVP